MPQKSFLYAQKGSDSEIQRKAGITGMSNTGKLRLVVGARSDRFETLNQHFTLLGDNGAARALIEDGCGRSAAEQIVQKWRRVGTTLKYDREIAYLVRPGFTLEQHAPTTGLCHRDFDYLQDWQLEHNYPTPAAIVFFVPRIIPESMGKSLYWQQKSLEEFREPYKLPTHHISSFGTAALLSGLILAHFEHTGERVPLDHLLVRTDTVRIGGWRLSLGYFTEKYGLDCQDWPWDPHRDPNLGCFPLGVEIIGR